MGGIIPAIGILVASVISAAQEDKNANRKDRACDLGRTLLDISHRVRDKHEAVKALLPQDDANLMIWRKAISANSIQTMTTPVAAFERFIFPTIEGPGSEVNIPELFYRRFLMRKLELQLQAVLTCVNEALPAVSGLQIVLSTYEDLARSGIITQSQAEGAKQKAFSQHPSVEVQPPNVPSNKTIFEELRQRDITTKVFMDEDPALEDTEQWLARIVTITV